MQTGEQQAMPLEFWAKVVSKLDLTEEQVRYRDNGSICVWDWGGVEGAEVVSKLDLTEEQVGEERQWQQMWVGGGRGLCGA